MLRQRLVDASRLVLVVVLSGIFSLDGVVLADDDKRPPRESTSGDTLFGLDRVHELHLEMTAEEWQAMQPARRGGFGGMRRRPEPETEKKGDRETHRSVFGAEFPWARTSFSDGETTYSDVGIRYKGNSTFSMVTAGAKRSFKIDFDYHVPDQRYRGRQKLNLNSCSFDPSLGRDALAYAAFRRAGVPAPRTAFAHVTITVPGKYDKEYLGLYTLIEQVDREFLRDRFEHSGGLRLKPEGVRSPEYLGDAWSRYEGIYRPKRTASPAESQRVMNFARFVSDTTDEEFAAQASSYLDVEEFLRFVAVTAMVSNLDNMFQIGHNYYMYLDPTTNRFIFMPWDLDLAFANFPMMGSREEQMDLSLTHPFSGENELFDRLMEIESVSALYRKVLEELATRLTKEWLLAQVDTIEKTTKSALEKEKQAREARGESEPGFSFNLGGGRQGPPPDLRTFVEKRTASIARQLAEESDGFQPRGMFGFGGGGTGQRLAAAFVKRGDTDEDEALTEAELVAAAAVLFKERDTEDHGRLDRSAVSAAIDALSAEGDAPGRRSGGFGWGRSSGSAWAASLLTAVDEDGDDHISNAELTAAAKTFFVGADRRKKGKLDRAAIARQLTRITPRPEWGGGQRGPRGR